ncbi:MAG: hypothetical protein J2P17_17235, partial [Mycobacterium sp.]|nr:hypothetical protein [Mycobacterium sp.]
MKNLLNHLIKGYTGQHGGKICLSNLYAGRVNADTTHVVVVDEDARRVRAVAARASCSHRRPPLRSRWLCCGAPPLHHG